MIYLDFSLIELHTIEKIIDIELKDFNIEKQNIKCIILDSWILTGKNAIKILNKICELYTDIPLVVMQTIEDSQFFGSSNIESINREFEILHLLALPRGHVRKVVSEYNKKRHIGDENDVIIKVTDDLDVLNIHRTPLNCLTLLKVAENFFDKSPINRTVMLENIMTILFNMEEIPNYKIRPDLKDCTYVLGYFSEKMIRNENYIFTRDYFLKELKQFCSDQLMDIEVEVVFDVLFVNNIIIKRNGSYCFRFSYWLYFFAANRMHHDDNFLKYIFTDKRYVSFPEIIEFYTGIDRRREDALIIFINDMKEICDIVNLKVGLPIEMNPYKFIKWNPTPESLEKVKNDISEKVLNSNLPDSVKDHYADKYYDYSKPYNQTIHSILQEYSLVVLMQSIKASSRALRNSDFVKPEIRRELLSEIFKGWEQMSRVLIALTPLLALNGRAAFDGAAFCLYGNFGDTIEKKINSIIQNVPFNVIQWYKNDLFSHKIGPLLFNQIKNETNELKKHEMINLLIYERPRNWELYVQNYIGAISKNSFYLYDILQTLKIEYRYGFISPKIKFDISYLIKMCLAKHEIGGVIPSKTIINKVPDSVLPERSIDSD
ncbi:MAG: hypothetical protein HXX18_03135 [Bacteroidetes bacterium]|nr:hypothetical protein [Bacteroidota bacterium]